MNEGCAQLGQTENFTAINRLEVDAYRAAIIARHGTPPEGCSLVHVSNRHDFGTWRTFGIRIEQDGHDNAAVSNYVERVEPGLGSWIEAGFNAPVRYDDAHTDNHNLPTIDDIIVSAMLTTRPDDDSRFPIADFALLHRNLADAYPAHAPRAAERLGMTQFPQQGDAQ